MVLGHFDNLQKLKNTSLIQCKLVEIDERSGYNTQRSKQYNKYFLFFKVIHENDYIQMKKRVREFFWYVEWTFENRTTEIEIKEEIL